VQFVAAVFEVPLLAVEGVSFGIEERSDLPAADNRGKHGELLVFLLQTLSVEVDDPNSQVVLFPVRLPWGRRAADG